MEDAFLIERLKLQMEEQSLTAIVAVKNRQVRLACYHGSVPESLTWRVLEGGRRLLRRLERVHITAWKKRFVAESADDRVAPWTLDLVADGVKRRITGDAYPENWASFVDVMNESPGVALPKIHQVEQLTLLYEGALAPMVGNPYAPRAASGTLVEKIAISRGKHILILTRHKQGYGTERHAFDSLRNIPVLLKRVDPALTDISARAAHQAAAGARRRRECGDGERLSIKYVRRTGEEGQLLLGPRSTWPESVIQLLSEISVLTYDLKSDLLAPGENGAALDVVDHADEKQDGEGGDK